MKEEDSFPLLSQKRRGRPKKEWVNQLLLPEFNILENDSPAKLERSRSVGTLPFQPQRYQFGKIISSGMIGVVYLARDMQQAFYP